VQASANCLANELRSTSGVISVGLDAARNSGQRLDAGVNSEQRYAVVRYSFVERDENKMVSFDVWKDRYDGRVTYNIAYAMGLAVTEYGAGPVKDDIEVEWAAKCDARGILITR
jgi:hypothetical protein